MSWQRRLVELLCAGGALASTGGYCANGNPDPCASGRDPPDSAQCRAETACTDRGGIWTLNQAPGGVDAGSGVEGHCILPNVGLDSGSEAPHDGPTHDAAHDAPRD